MTGPLKLPACHCSNPACEKITLTANLALDLLDQVLPDDRVRQFTVAISVLARLMVDLHVTSDVVAELLGEHAANIDAILVLQNLSNDEAPDNAETSTRPPHQC